MVAEAGDGPWRELASGLSVPATYETPPTYENSDLAEVLSSEEYESGPVGEAQQMFDIADRVAGVRLHQLRPGFIMYGDVTQMVYDEQERFAYRQKIFETVSKFASYAKDPLNSHINGHREEVPLLWQDLYYGSDPISVIAALRKFWKAHIVVDLFLTLGDTDTQERHKEDFFLVDAMLCKVAENLFSEHIRVPRHIGKLGLKFMMSDVYRDRRNAWRDGRDLVDLRSSAQGPERENIEQAMVAAAVKRGRRAVNLSQPFVDKLFRLAGGATSLEWQEEAS